MSVMRRLRGGPRRRVLGHVLVVGGLAAFVALTYVVLVLGGGALTGHTSSPDLALSVLATAVVALAFDPVQSRLEALSTSLVHGGRAAPYDVLSRFSETVTGSHPAEELPARMAHVLADGTGGEWAQVWLVLDGHPTLAATWPGPHEEVGPVELDGFARHDAPGRRSLPVRHRGELLGVLVVQERPEVPLSAVEERLFHELASQAGQVLRGARLRAELLHRSNELAARAEQLRASRQRLVDVQDAKRRVLERDIHDGAQQHLVALAVNLRLAETLAASSPDRSARLLAEQVHAAEDAISTLLLTARGIYPPQLTEEGLPAALRSAVANSPTPIVISASDIGRYDVSVEGAAYFSCLEAVQNAVKHSGATRIRVTLRDDGGTLEIVVEDDGRGFAAEVPPGTGLMSLRDRVESVDGTLSTESTPGRGTRVHVRLPQASGRRAVGSA